MGAGDGSRAVLVTGGSRGIGRAVARAFAAQGDRIAVHGGSSQALAEQVLAELPGTGHVPVQADMADAGAVVNVSSRGAFRGEPNNPAYGASKAGLDAFAQMAREVLDGPGGDAVRARSPFGRIARPEEVASAVLWPASPAARFSSGTVVDVNGASCLRT